MSTILAKLTLTEYINPNSSNNIIVDITTTSTNEISFDDVESSVNSKFRTLGRTSSPSVFLTFDDLTHSSNPPGASESPAHRIPVSGSFTITQIEILNSTKNIRVKQGTFGKTLAQVTSGDFNKYLFVRKVIFSSAKITIENQAFCNIGMYYYEYRNNPLTGLPMQENSDNSVRLLTDDTYVYRVPDYKHLYGTSWGEIYDRNGLAIHNFPPDPPPT